MLYNTHATPPNHAHAHAHARPTPIHTILAGPIGVLGPPGLDPDRRAVARPRPAAAALLLPPPHARTQDGRPPPPYRADGARSLGAGEGRALDGGGRSACAGRPAADSGCGGGDVTRGVSVIRCGRGGGGRIREMLQGARGKALCLGPLRCRPALSRGPVFGNWNHFQYSGPDRWCTTTAARARLVYLFQL